MTKSIKDKLSQALTKLNPRDGQLRQGDDDRVLTDMVGFDIWDAGYLWQLLESNEVDGWGVAHRYGYRWLVQR